MTIDLVDLWRRLKRLTKHGSWVVSVEPDPFMPSHPQVRLSWSSSLGPRVSHLHACLVVTEREMEMRRVDFIAEHAAGIAHMKMMQHFPDQPTLPEGGKK